MKISLVESNNIKVGVLALDAPILNTVGDILDLIGNTYYQGVKKIIVHKEQLHPDFFQLRTGLAGEILQKFSNYQAQLAIVGDFSNIDSKALRDFIFESNKLGQINFVASMEEAIAKLTKNT